MSSYLNIYLKERDTKEYLLLDSYSRSSEIYQRFNENVNPAYAGMEEKYTDLTTKDLDCIIRELADEKSSIDKRIKLYDKYLRQVVDYIDPELPEAPKPKKSIEGNETIDECIITLGYLKEEYIDLDDAMKYVDFLYTIQQGCESKCNAFECIAVNID